MKEKIIQYLEEKKECKIRDLEKIVRPKSSKEFTEMVKSLNELEDEKLIYNDHTSLYLIDDIHFMAGSAKDISRYEIAVFNENNKVYVPKNKKMKIFDKDEVLVRLKPEPSLIKVFNHGLTNITGVMIVKKKKTFFYSDLDLHCSIRVVNEKEFSFKKRTKVVCQIVKYADSLEVRIIQVLGHPDDAGVDISAMLTSNQVRQVFNGKIVKECKRIPAKVQKDELENRKDLRNLLTVTIDGDDAKDFDDAISIVKNEKGYLLYVHIADVSHYVKENSALDQEAYLRGNSIYVCDRVVPMLPFDLSNGICSLNPNVDRLTITCAMQVDERGNLLTYNVFPSVIHSDKRCTYKKVNACLAGDETILEEYAEVKDLLFTLEPLAKLLKKQSHNRGCIDFNTKEAKIIMDKNGYPVDVTVLERGFAEQMIEECMILANVCVAHHMHVNKIPSMYRVHENPDPKKVATICTVANSLRIPFDFYPDEVNASQIQKFLESIQDENAYEVLSMVALRSMQKARYDAHCLGHFGLALEEYCHFTSPIRRYSDLVVHRMLHAYCFNEQKRTPSNDEKKIEKQAFHISEKERDAIMMERMVNDYKKAQFMEKRIGQVFEGTIVGVMSFGFFVEMDNTVEGLVPVHTLSNDFYDYDEDTMTLKGQTHGKVFQMGMRVRVVCTDVQREKGQVTFSLLERRNHD
ncbi:ribonuclease R [Holdemanella porci]|uniref:ribonuclease R n=1 Tax=Holdemanella porci TaxID=2652276 RepID=UPI003AF08560